MGTWFQAAYGSAAAWNVGCGKSLRTLYIQHLREYYLVGGMPEAVNKFIETNDANAVREVQEEIIRAYEKTFPSMHQRAGSKNQPGMELHPFPTSQRE